MAENTAPSIKAEPVEILTANIEKVKAEPAETLTANIDKAKADLESVTSQKTGNDTATNPHPTTAQVDSPKTNGQNTASPSGSAKKPVRTPPCFDAATEDHVRDLLVKARKVANSGDNSFNSEEDVYDLALLTNNLVQLMNAAYIATDTVVRGVAYLQGGTNPHPKTAISFARRDRREQLSQKATGQGLGDATNLVPAEASTTNRATADATEDIQVAKITNATKAGENAGPTKENAVLATEDQQQNSEPAQNKSNKKKRFWNNRRGLRKRKDSANAKTPDDKATGVVEANGAAEEKEAVKEHKPETSGSDTAIEERVDGTGVVIAVKV